MIGQYSCDVGVIVGAYLPTPTQKKDDAALREALDDEYPLLVKSHGHRLLCFCGDLNATLSKTLDSTKWFGGPRYTVSRTILENCINNLHLVDVVRNKWPATAKYTAFQSRPKKHQYWRARPDHFLVPQGRASRVEDVVVPDGEQWVRHVGGERYISLDKEGHAPAARTTCRSSIVVDDEAILTANKPPPQDATDAKHWGGARKSLVVGHAVLLRNLPPARARQRRARARAMVKAPAAAPPPWPPRRHLHESSSCALLIYFFYNQDRRSPTTGLRRRLAEGPFFVVDAAALRGFPPQMLVVDRVVGEGDVGPRVQP